MQKQFLTTERKWNSNWIDCLNLNGRDYETTLLPWYCLDEEGVLPVKHTNMVPWDSGRAHITEETSCTPPGKSTQTLHLALPLEGSLHLISGAVSGAPPLQRACNSVIRPLDGVSSLKTTETPSQDHWLALHPCSSRGTLSPDPSLGSACALRWDLSPYSSLSQNN